MALTFTIAGVDKTSVVRLPTLRISMGLESQWTAEFIVRDTDSTSSAYRPALDATVVIADGATTLFRGLIARVVDEPLAPPRIGTKTTVRCRSTHDVVDQILVDKTYGADPVIIANSSVANPTNITTAGPHGLSTGDTVLISDHVGSTPSVNGNHTVTVTGSQNFTIPVNVTVSGGGGTVQVAKTLKSIVTDLRTTYLAAHSVTLDSGMANGPYLLKQDYQQVTLRSVFDRLSVLSGWFYRITPGLELQFYAAGDKTAGFSITSTSNAVGAVSWEKARDRYANTIVLKYGGTTRGPRMQIITGNGSATSWELDYQPVIDPATGFIDVTGGGYVTDGGDFMPLGVEGVDSTTWTYEVSTNLLHRTSALPSGQVATFVFQVQFPQTVTVVDATEVSARGTWAAPYDAPDIQTRNEAEDAADGVLRRLLVAPKKVTVTTRAGLVLPGDQITLTFTNRTVSGNYQVLSVVGVSDVDKRMRYTLECVEGTEHQESFTDLMRQRLNGGTLRAAGGTLLGTAIAPEVITDPTFRRIWLQDTSNTEIDCEDLNDRVDDVRFFLRLEGAAGYFAILDVERGPDYQVGTIVVEWVPGQLDLDDNVAVGGWISERGRSTPLGEWIAVAHDDANYTGNSTGNADWVVDSGDQVELRFTKFGKTAVLSYVIQNTDVANAPTQLRIALPSGQAVATSRRFTNEVARAVDAGTVVEARAVIDASVSTGLLLLLKKDGSAWTNTGGDDTTVEGQIIYETAA